MKPFRRDLFGLLALGALAGPAMAQPALAFSAGPEALVRLAARLRALDQDGLDPAAYAVPADSLAYADPYAWQAGLARSAALALADLLHGRLRNPPNRPDILRDTAALPLDQWQAALSASVEPAQLLDRAALLPPDAAALKAALAQARAVAAAGGWAPIPGGPSDTIEPGAWDSTKVPLLRARLAATDPAVARTGPNQYDPALVAAVKRFQDREGLEADGRIGRITLAALNRPPEATVNQLRAALDMRRAAAQPGPERRIEVNIPHQRFEMLEAGQTLLAMNVVVGRPGRATPLLRVRMTAIQFNPRWSAPVRNAREDLLPRFQRDPRAMMEKGFRVYTIVNGQYVELDPLGIDWRRVNPQHFPYAIKQDAGGDNALGRLKFIMPNGDDIYMHDTPDRQYFRRPDRAFSSGCIRLEKPMELLELAVQGTPYIDRARAEKLLADRTSATISLRQTVPVRLHYTTAVVTDGRVILRPDIYGLDESYVRAMDAPPRIAASGVR